MEEQGPPGGWPLRMAITSLVPPSMATVARQLLQLEALPQTPPGSLDTSRRLLWLEICERVQLHQLEAEGFKAGEDRVSKIEPKFFNSATPDYDADTLSSHGVTYHGVRVFVVATAPSLPTSTSQETLPPAGACSDQELRKFYQSRVLNWKIDEPPTEKMDIEDALTHFGVEKTPSRERLRNVRKAEAPADWQVGRGRPRKSRA